MSTLHCPDVRVSQGAGSCSAAASAGVAGVQNAAAAQRGAEDAYATQVFDATVCVKRTALGACAEQGGLVKVAEEAAPEVAAAEQDEERQHRVERQAREDQAEQVQAPAAEVRAIDRPMHKLVSKKPSLFSKTISSFWLY